MTERGDTPKAIQTFLCLPIVGPALRILLVSAYLVAGFMKIFDFVAAAAEQDAFGLHPGWLWATMAIIVEVLGSALVVAGRFVWVGAGALGVLTAIATLVAHRFWTMEGHERFVATNTFFEHLGLIAGLGLVSIAAVLRDRAAVRS
jgi:uncharacterized membrane protein YphA (DoxX/SURF4 family)